MAQALYPSDLTGGRRVLWLLTVEWAGYTLRLASDDVDVVTEAGESLPYASGLDEIDLSESISLLGDSTGQLSIPLEFLTPAGMSIAYRVSLGDDLSTARGELSRWVEGTTYEQRRVVLVGRLVDPEYGADDEPVSTSLEETLPEDRAQIPGPGATVTATTWAHTDSLVDGSVGVAYPVVIGTPGVVDDSVGAQGWIPGTPAVWVDHRAEFEVANPPYYPDITHGLFLVIAGHHVSATRVYLNTDADPTGARFVVVNDYDQAGQPVALVPFFSTTDAVDIYEFDMTGTNYQTLINDADGVTSYGLGSTVIDDSYSDAEQSPVFVGWLDPLTGGGGLQVGGQTIREAGDVMEWLLSQSTIPVDYGRFAAAKAALSRFKLDGVISARVSPWAVLRDEILPLLPVSLVSGPAGIYPIVWNYLATAADAVLDLDADTNPAIERTGRVKYDSSDRSNRIEVSYAYSYRRQKHAGRIVLGAAADQAEDATVQVHPLCERSRTRTGQRLESTLETAWVYDTTTAQAVAEWQAAALALPMRTVDYQLPEVEYVQIERGQVVTVTDSTVYLSRQVALVQQVSTDGTGYLTVTLLLLDR